ncbi:centrosomal protein kizuna isoform X2 [Hyperolius riggenbachi]
MKRLELEKKLFQYSSSDEHLFHLKYVKLKHSLKEVIEKEKKAHLRNQAFLQEFDVIEARFHALLSNSQASHNTKMLQVSRQAEINTSSDMSRRIHHPATIFMGRQMSANSSIEHSRTQRKSPQSTKSFSISDPHSVRQAAITSNLTDSCVVPANSDTQCLNKPDKIDVETSSSQIRPEMPVTSVTSSEEAAPHRAEIDETQSARKHQVENKQSAQLSTQTLARLSPENRTEDLQNDSPSNKVEESLMYERLPCNEERYTQASPSGSPPDACDFINKQTSENYNATENLPGSPSLPKQEDDDFFNSSSDLTVSITDSEDMAADDLLDTIDGKEEKTTVARVPKEDIVSWMANKIPSNQEQQGATDHHSHGRSSSVSTISQNNLSDKGFIHLLQSIEDLILQMGSNDFQLYQNASLTPSKRDHLVSLCNQLKTLRKEDLEACCALVVQHLQTEEKQSLLEKSNHKHNSEKEERTISPLLRNHLLGHVSFLKERGILKGGIPAGFVGALIPDDEMETQQAHLQTTNNKRDLSSFSSSETQSCLIPEKDHKTDGPSRPIQHVDYKLTKQDDTSSCEDDSRRGKFLEKRRGAANSNIVAKTAKETDHNRKDIDEDLSSISEIEIPGLSPANISSTRKTAKPISETTISSSESSPEHRKETINNRPAPVSQLVSNKGPTNIKSKAFWGESEDSSSEIEAMLRPQVQNNDADDFDDFFD